MLHLHAQARPLLSRVQNFVTTTEPALLAEYAIGGVAAYYLVRPGLHKPSHQQGCDGLGCVQ